MPIYMDVHIVPGVKSLNVAEAHRQDLLHQEEYGCNCMTYWIDEGRESVFCLIEAPSKEAVIEMHDRAHGLIPHKIIEVNSSVVQSFLGRIYDPEEAEPNEEGLKVFSDPSLRILVVTKTTDPLLLQYNLGTEKANELLANHNSIIRKNLQLFGGREVEHEGSGFIISFSSAAKAVSCALAIQKDLSPGDADAIGFKMSINSGEPIEKSNKLFGDTIQLAQHMCTISRYFHVAMASSVKALVSKDQYQVNGTNILTLSPQDEALLEQLFTILEANWQNPEFDVDDYCKAMAMSKSQLYRKTISLTGLSPNILLKEFRLEKAKELMKKQYHNIAQVTFDSGFTSPSYFTKCFKKKYGLLPMNYIDLLQ
ncbi:MAG TPA: nickel-binding protein [Flavisolibacter sp.]|nr:nickel-binding protein [Flavisolibacter sp.]